MSRAAARLGLFIASMATTYAASATTCVSQIYGANSAGSIGIVSSAGVNDDWISGGISHWDVCDTNAFPALYCNQAGDYTFTVYYQLGPNPDGAGCGSLNPALEWDGSAWIVKGGAINLFEKDGFGLPCDNSTTVRAHTVAHEIGHILGLNDSSCTNTMMGSSSAGVQPEECAEAGALWETPFEVAMDDCNASCWTACNASAQCPAGTVHWDSGTNWFDPLVFDLENDGIRTVTGAGAVWFDLDADGDLERITWVGPGDAFLWTDLNRNNRVDDGSELFGVGTLLPDGTRAVHGYEALAVHDRASKGGNENGSIDRGDAIWNRLRLWRDMDGDAVCDAGETSPIHRSGVKEIGLQWVANGWVDDSGTVHLLRGSFRKRVTGDGDAEYIDYGVEALGFRLVN